MSGTSVDFYLADRSATERLGRVLGETLGPMTLLLEGPLGAGKTALIQGLGLGLGIGEPIVSPTFTLINEYPEGRVPLYHLDLYRLSPGEVLGLDLDQYWDPIEREPGILAIEWPDRLGYRPADRFQVTLAYGNDREPDSRWVTIEAMGAAVIDPRWVLALAS